MPQTSYLQLGIPAMPGMAFDAETAPRDVVSAVASTAIPFGSYCELVLASGQYLARLAQTSVTTGLLAQTVTTTNGSASVTFSANVTLPAGAQMEFSGQPGTYYYLAAAIAAATAGTLTELYNGTGAAGQIVIMKYQPIAGGICLYDELGAEENYVPFQVPISANGSTSPGYLKGQVIPLLRRGRIWVLGDAGGTINPYAINVWHSSTGANLQGVFTFSPSSQTVGAEIDLAPGIIPWPATNTGAAYPASATDPFGNLFKAYPVEVNL
jgi:hypothetical protein